MSTAIRRQNPIHSPEAGRERKIRTEPGDEVAPARPSKEEDKGVRRRREETEMISNRFGLDHTESCAR